jgi:Ran GTPase-activating protein (RanGAP) involved in mRNA processing and transport
MEQPESFANGSFPVRRQLNQYPLRGKRLQQDAKIVGFHLEERYQKKAQHGTTRWKVCEDDEDGALDVLLHPKVHPALKELLPQIRHNMIEEANAAGNGFEDENIASIAQVLSYNSSLTLLSLGNNRMTDISCFSVVDSLAGNKTLMQLKLEFNQITDEGAAVIANSLLADDASGLTVLSLQYNLITDKCTEELAAALHTNKTLLSLLVGGNKIGDEGGYRLTDTLQYNGVLKVINLVGCDRVSKKCQNALQKVLDMPIHQRVLDHSCIPPAQVAEEEEEEEVEEVEPKNPLLQKMLTEIRADDPALTKVKLHGQDLDDEECTHLCNALQTNSTITSLSLGGNAIGDEGATALASALRFNHSISTIWLGNNLIGDEGAAELGDALLTNSTLSVLSLHNNKIGDKGAREFLKALGHEVREQSWAQKTENFEGDDGGGDENKDENGRSGGGGKIAANTYSNAGLVHIEDGPGMTSQCMLEMLNLHGNLVRPALQSLLQEVAEISIYEEEEEYNAAKPPALQLQMASSAGTSGDPDGGSSARRSSTPKRRLQQAQQFDSSLRDEEDDKQAESKEDDKQAESKEEGRQAENKESDRHTQSKEEGMQAENKEEGKVGLSESKQAESMEAQAIRDEATWADNERLEMMQDAKDMNDIEAEKAMQAARFGEHEDEETGAIREEKERRLFADI